MELEKFEAKSLATISPLMLTAQELRDRAAGQPVTNDAELKAANSIKKEINAHAKAVKDMRLELSRPIDAFKDKLIGKEREILSPLDEAKNGLARKILDYEDELERQRLAEEQRVSALIGQIEGLYRAGMTSDEVVEGKASGKAIMEALSATDRENPRLKLALSATASRLTDRLAQIEEEERAAAERKRQEEEAARLKAEARKQSVKEAELAAERAEVEAESRRIEAEKQRLEREKRELEGEKERQRLAAEAAEVEKEAAKAEAARPKSNIATTTDFEIVDAALVPRELCSPDEKKIRALLKGGEITTIPGVRIFEKKTVR